METSGGLRGPWGDPWRFADVNFFIDLSQKFLHLSYLGATSIDKIGEVRLSDEIGGRGLKL